MTNREKLVELIGQVQDEGADYSNTFMETESPASVENYELADYLLKNGVTFAADNYVGHKWISVTEMVPSFPERVLVYLKPEPYAYTSIDTDRVRNGKWVRWQGCVTHWMHLPEPPKEDK